MEKVCRTDLPLFAIENMECIVRCRAFRRMKNLMIILTILLRCFYQLPQLTVSYHCITASASADGTDGGHFINEQFSAWLYCYGWHAWIACTGAPLFFFLRNLSRVASELIWNYEFCISAMFHSATLQITRNVQLFWCFDNFLPCFGKYCYTEMLLIIHRQCVLMSVPVVLHVFQMIAHALQTANFRTVCTCSAADVRAVIGAVVNKIQK